MVRAVGRKVTSRYNTCQKAEGDTFGENVNTKFERTSCWEMDKKADPQ